MSDDLLFSRERRKRGNLSIPKKRKSSSQTEGGSHLLFLEGGKKGKGMKVSYFYRDLEKKEKR